MKVAVYSAKGGCGKTPLSICIALDEEYALVTNESYDALSDQMEESRLLYVKSDQDMPNFDDGIEVVFDLAGTMTSGDFATVSALKQSDVVVIPMCNNLGALKAGIKTIRAVHKLNKPVIIAATKLRSKTKKKNEDWQNSSDYITISEWVSSTRKDIGYLPAIIPVRFSELFESVISNCQSIRNLAKQNPLLMHSQKDLIKQLDELYKEIKKHA